MLAYNFTLHQHLQATPTTAAVFHACAGKRKLLHKKGVCVDHRNMAAAPVTMLGRLKGKDGERQSSLFEACKNGDLERVKKFLTPENVNSRDTAGRKSTPLHFAAGITVS